MSTATAILAYGYDLGGPGDRQGWAIPTRPDGHPDVTWYDPDDKDLSFGQQAAAHLLTVKGITPGRDGMDDDLAQDLWNGVHIISYGTDNEDRWLIATHETNVTDLDAPESLNMLDLIQAHNEWNRNLLAALEALGIPAPAEPDWHLAAYYG